MKLYTEQQVKYILDLAHRSGVHIAKISVDVDKKLKPIELPSDEEIEETFTFYPQMIEGAKWIRNKLTKTKDK